MKKICAVILVIIGTIIGAGFASGKEIDLFFFSYQKNGFYGLAVSSIFIAIIIYMVFYICNKENIPNYEAFLKQICKFGERKNNIIFYSIQLIINTFLLISFYIMIAGFGAYFEQELGVNKIIGISIISVLCYYCFKKRTKGLVKVNTFLVPILIIFIFYLGFINPYHYGNISLEIVNTKGNWLLSALIYSSYNSIILIPILITLKEEKIKKIQNIIISVACAILIFLLGQTIYFLLFNLTEIQNLEIPTVAVANSFHPIYQYLFGFIILISIFTSCVSCGYAFLENYEGEKYNNKNKIICISAIFIAQMGFSNLVNILYPMFGILGFIQIILLLYQIIIKRV